MEYYVMKGELYLHRDVQSNDRAQNVTHLHYDCTANTALIIISKRDLLGKVKFSNRLFANLTHSEVKFVLS